MPSSEHRLDIRNATELILDRREQISAARALLVAVSGIDGCGKGYLSAKLAQALRDRGLNPAVINIDGWLNLPSLRFNPAQPAGHFYRNAIRFEEMFEKLVLPLRRAAPSVSKPTSLKKPLPPIGAASTNTPKST
jgi:uridine kinase